MVPPYPVFTPPDFFSPPLSEAPAVRLEVITCDCVNCIPVYCPSHVFQGLVHKSGILKNLVVVNEDRNRFPQKMRNKNAEVPYIGVTAKLDVIFKLSPPLTFQFLVNLPQM